MKYRKKPVVIEALQFTGDNFVEVMEWSKGRVARSQDNHGLLAIATLEGTMIGSPDDYIIRGVKGEYYACKPDIFKETYESADEEG